MNSFRKRFLCLLSAAVLLVGIVCVGYPQTGQSKEKTKQEFDLILHDGTIIDGTGSKRYTADVGISDGYIQSIGNLDGAIGKTEINVSGKIVSPGFIDMHSHADTEVLATAKSSLTQGVTTELISPDGGGPVDLSYMSELEDKGLAINIGSYIGFNSVWEEVVGFNDRRATAEEITGMQSLIEEALQKGAWGISAGLFYAPGNYAKMQEVIDVVSIAEKWRTNFPNHIRNENSHVLEATAETIEIGENAGIVPVITHMKVMGPSNWGKSLETIKLIQDANKRGTFAAADQYPYLASQTGLIAIVPQWVQDGGHEEMLKRFADPAMRGQIEEEIHETIQSRVSDAGDVYFPTKQTTLADIAAEQGVSPGEATMQILEKEGSIRTIYFFGHQEDFERILKNPTTAIASDGGATVSSSTHPRRYGTQPRVLGKLVREEGLLSLEEAVQKMSGLPANIIGMVDRGFIAEGMIADITVFDATTVTDKATFDNPKQYAEGIEHVIINGQFAIKNSEPTGVQAGKALKRSYDMPSRPISLNEAHKVFVKGQLVNENQGGAKKGPKINIMVDQQADQTQSKAKLQIIDKDNNVQINLDKLGILQTYKGWASFTGTVKLKKNETMPILVTIDEKDPFTRKETIRVKIGENYLYSGTLKGELKVD
ncbi:amidohydrolase family protein [Cytobacillus firmus]|uniref:N-acyl-D-amino-acid deacylase family protein n=1 Tax=Cytobacillus firmus TaxID=1399 RepID=UPI001C8EFA66|nr:D-aminoacylase [Cytobacillus firmus]MBX9975969.1 D-aminoacylase [Cytobacillus firmus]